MKRALPAQPRRRWLPIAAIALFAAATMAGCVSSSSDGTRSAATASRLHGVPTTPPYSAPPLRLRNYNGNQVDLTSYRGKAVLVTFIYTHCPDVCPLIVGHLHAALAELGPKAKQLQIVAVSVDPKGDTPKTVTKFLREHQMRGRMDYLIGSRPQLERTWKAWGIGAQVPKRNPELVEHSAYVFGIDASGKVDTLYSANFQPSWIVRDAPVLAAS
jgi:protein SCO1/2